MFDVTHSTVNAAGSEEDHTRPARTLYVACPILLSLVLGLSLVLPHGVVVYAFYAIAVVSALPTWDRRFVREMSLAAAVFVLLDTALMQPVGTDAWQRLLNCCAGLLAIWAGLHLALEAIAAYEARLQEMVSRSQALARDNEVTGPSRCPPVPTAGATIKPPPCDHLVILCAWTKRVKEDGKWVPLEEFLERHFQVRVSHGMSDEVHDTMVRKQNLSEPDPPE
jgi:hypothetical protein